MLRRWERIPCVASQRIQTLELLDLYHVESTMAHSFTHWHSLVLLFLATNTTAFSQADGLVAYVPEKPIERTADDPRISIVESAVAGKIEAIVPADAVQVDLLNARGNVKRSCAANEMDGLRLSDLPSGTWTLRVHRPGSMLIRRFVVLQRGSIVWTPSGPIRKK